MSKFGDFALGGLLGVSNLVADEYGRQNAEAADIRKEERTEETTIRKEERANLYTIDKEGRAGKEWERRQAIGEEFAIRAADRTAASQRKRDERLEQWRKDAEQRGIANKITENAAVNALKVGQIEAGTYAPVLEDAAKLDNRLASDEKRIEKGLPVSRRAGESAPAVTSGEVQNTLKHQIAVASKIASPKELHNWDQLGESAFETMAKDPDSTLYDAILNEESDEQAQSMLARAADEVHYLIGTDVKTLTNAQLAGRGKEVVDPQIIEDYMTDIDIRTGDTMELMSKTIVQLHTMTQADIEERGGITQMKSDLKDLLSIKSGLNPRSSGFKMIWKAYTAGIDDAAASAGKR